MNIEKLIYLYEKNNKCGHFFDKQTLKFFGECLSDMRVLNGEYVITDTTTGKENICYCISRLQRNHPNGATRTHAFFDTTTFEPVIIPEDETITRRKNK